MRSELKPKTAVLYFALSPVVQARTKVLAPGMSFKTNVSVAQLLRDHTSREIDKSGLPFILFDEENQPEGTFGDKIAHAFETVFNRGYDHVIAIGSDTPQLESRHLSKSADLLNDGSASIVLGPSADGGTWLMGFSRDAFSPDTFKNLPWNSTNLFSAILDQYQPDCTLHILECFRDIDYAEDLQRFLISQSADGSLKQLRQDICTLFGSAVTFACDFEKSSDTEYNHFSFLLRGPPATSDSNTLTI
jgi:glycosyltransferase A (GT-A) superfamily protein (DUF2064 family)